MIIAELEKEIALKELQLENYAGLRTEFDIRKEEDLLYMLRHLKPIALERYSPEPVVEKVAPFELPGVTTDWDFNSTSWALDTQTYVSSPSSIKFSGQNFAMLKQSAAGQAIVNGRVETYHRADGFKNYVSAYAASTILFRSNASDGSTSATTLYFLELYNPSGGSGSPATNVVLYLYNSGTYTSIGSASLSTQLNANTWYRIRATWWVSQGVLVTRLEYYNNGQWSSLCPDFTDNRNAGASNTTNRVGVGSGASYSYSWHDDTVIYVAV